MLRQTPAPFLVSCGSGQVSSLIFPCLKYTSTQTQVAGSVGAPQQHPWGMLQRKHCRGVTWRALTALIRYRVRGVRGRRNI